MGEAKRRKAVDPFYGKRRIDLPLEETVNYFTVEGNNLFSSELIDSYRNFLTKFDRKPSNNIFDYDMENNPDFYRIFAVFLLANKESFTNPMKMIAIKFRYERNRDNFNRVLVHLWMALGFAAYQKNAS